MTEAHPPVESVRQQRNIAQEQYIGIKRLYSDIFSMTSMEQRREIARHYEWINPQNPLNAVCRRRVDYTGNIAPNSPNSVAYDLCDEYRLSEAGLVRDTLIQDQQLARFNGTVRMVNNGQLSPDHINMADLTNVIDILLKYDVLGTQEFRDELLNRNKRPIILTNKEILRLREQLNEILARHTGQSLEKIGQDTDRDFHMSGQQAKDYGLVDEVIVHRDLGSTV